MINFFVLRIIDGKLTFEEVPDKYKDAVEKKMIERNLEHLIKKTNRNG